MATIFTHSFTVALLVLVVPEPIPRARLMVVLIVLSIVPDLDVIAFLYQIPYGDPFGHRGITHSISFALVTAFLSTVLFHRYVKFFTRQWVILFSLLAMAIISHGLLDAMTDAGLGVGFFIPFHDERYFFPWRPFATSPIGITAFFNKQAIGILINEFVWIWLPLLGLVGVRYIILRCRGCF